MESQNKKSRRVTIREVAREAGVDRSTVSRVFNQPHLLREKTVFNVKSVARQLGYSPNSAARALRTGRNENIALIVPDLTNPFMPPIALAVQKEAAKLGYCVFIGNADEDPSHEEDLLLRFSDQVSGAVLASPRSDQSTIERLAEIIPLVLINRDILGIPRVLIDSGQGMTEAVKHLANLGHKHMVYVSGPAQSWSNEQRQMSVEKATKALKIELTVVSAKTASFSSGVNIVDELLAVGASACIAFDDVLAQGICQGLEGRHVTVPRDFSVIGCDDILGFPQLTTVTSPSASAGRKSVKMLACSILSDLSPNTRLVLDTNLLLRNTSGPPKIKY